MRAILWRSILLLTLSALALLLGGVSSVRAATPDLSHRYIVFIDGIAPNYGNPPPPDPQRSFTQIAAALTAKGVNKFTYFSYSAAQHYAVGDSYCLGWGTRGCATNRYGLSSLSIDPHYSQADTQIDIDEQSKALDWLLQQVVTVSGDKQLSIDIVAFSLGGVIASRWAATMGVASPVRGKIHAITTIESPVGGIPAAGPFSSGLISEGGAWSAFVQHLFGEPVLKELQLPSVSGGAASSPSIVSSLEKAPALFPLTSIESTQDYVVNDKSIPVCANALCNLGHDEVSIGRGSQYWVNSPRTWLGCDPLGGAGLQTNPVDLLDGQQRDAIVKLIFSNHGAPLTNKKGVSWVVEAVTDTAVGASDRCPGTVPPAQTTGTPSPTPSSSSVTTEFVVDTSGSMNDPAAQGDVAKIDAAKSAVGTLLTFIQQEQQNGEAQQVGLVPFNDQVHDGAPPGTDFDALRSRLKGLQAGGSTDIYDALKTAIDQAASAAPATKKLVILVTDGGQNTPQLSVQDFLDGPVKDAAARGISICTIGFGQGGDLDESLLQQIASPDCGFAAAGNEVKLQQQYIKLRAGSLGTIAQEFQGTVQQGQTVQIGTVELAANMGLLNVADVWPGSTLKLHIKDPAGKEIVDGSGGASDVTTPTSENVLINQPAAGTWTISLDGVQVAAGGEPYYVLASTRAAAQPAPDPAPDPAPPSSSTSAITPTSPSGDAGIIAGTLVGGGIVLGLGLLLATRKRAPALDLFAEGGVRVPLRRGTLTLGRDTACEVRFGDPAISGRHAQITVDDHAITVFDLESRFGTFVNGRQIARSPLVAGDRLQLGNTELVVWSAHGA